VRVDVAHSKHLSVVYASRAELGGPMKIDRANFLVLTASIAACAGQDPPPAAPLDIPIVSTPPSATSGATKTAATATPNVSASVASGSASDEAGPSTEAYASNEGGAGYTACGRSPRTFDATRVGCDDSVGAGAAAPSCSRMKSPAGSCAPFAFPKQECETWRANYKPRVADAAIACADRLSSDKVCDACNVYRCGNDALMGACPDSSAATDCRAFARICPSVDQNECVALLSGMSAVGRAKMATCMKGRCDGVYSCSESL
jgi:hypothetical protein